MNWHRLYAFVAGGVVGFAFCLVLYAITPRYQSRVHYVSAEIVRSNQIPSGGKAIIVTTLQDTYGNLYARPVWIARDGERVILEVRE